MAGKDVAVKNEGGALAAFDDDFLQEAAELGGAGRTKSMDDNVVPFISLLQDMSPEVKKRDPDYVEGAEPGMILNKATSTVHAELEVQPWAAERCINQWTPREAGGGFRGRHPFNGTVEASMKAAGGKSKPDPQDPAKTIWVLPNGDTLVDTRYVYVNVIEREGGVIGEGAIVKITPALIAFSSTGHTVAKQWSTLRNNSTLPNGAEHPIWYKSYRMRTKAAKNNKGDFFTLAFDDLGDAGWMRDPDARAKGKELNASWAAGGIRTADEAEASDADDVQGDGRSGDDNDAI